MKVLFVGPSLYASAADLAGLTVRAPACCGDILDAVRDGANCIGLVDGNFEAAASVWHKEILYALSLGVTVLGSSSMGALRAAECAAFGMVPVGRIARAYADGTFDDDAAVALQHGPAELGYPPLSIPMVDVDSTLHALVRDRQCSPDEAARIARRAAAIHFKDRTVAAICEGESDLAGRFETHFFSQKGADALELIHTMRALPDSRGEAPRDWQLAGSPFWVAMARLRGVDG